jgi:hypothetical protein
MGLEGSQDSAHTVSHLTHIWIIFWNAGNPRATLLSIITKMVFVHNVRRVSVKKKKSLAQLFPELLSIYARCDIKLVSELYGQGLYEDLKSYRLRTY